MRASWAVVVADRDRRGCGQSTADLIPAQENREIFTRAGLAAATREHVSSSDQCLLRPRAAAYLKHLYGSVITWASASGRNERMRLGLLVERLRRQVDAGRPDDSPCLGID